MRLPSHFIDKSHFLEITWTGWNSYKFVDSSHDKKNYYITGLTLKELPITFRLGHACLRTQASDSSAESTKSYCHMDHFFVNPTKNCVSIYLALPTDAPFIQAGSKRHPSGPQLQWKTLSVTLFRHVGLCSCILYWWIYTFFRSPLHLFELRCLFY